MYARCRIPLDPEMGETIAALTGQSDTILLGRRTYEMFAGMAAVRSEALSDRLTFERWLPDPAV